VLGGALLACGGGGANANQHGVGDEPGGVALGLGDIAVAPVGNYVLFRRGDGLAVGDVSSGKIGSLPVTQPERLAFSKQRPFVYVGSGATDEVLAIDVEQRRVSWHTAVVDTDTATTRLMSSKDDRFVVVAQPTALQVLDAATGAEVGSFEFEQPLVDVQILPDSKRAIAVEFHQWDGDAPQTRVTVLDLETSTKVTLQVPNCADRVAISGDSQHALLAPTTCQKDPISVIDLAPGAEKFDRNLPGFGPVALSPDGSTAVAFLDRDKVDLSLFDDPSLAPTDSTERYHLMLIDTNSMQYEFAAAGPELPRFAITPDGNVLLVDAAFVTSQGVRLFDIATRTFKKLAGPGVTLENFVLTSDSEHAYVLQSSVYDLDIGAAQTSVVETGFEPTNINISADDTALFLRKSDEEICIFDLATRSCGRRFVVAQVP
jgi:outer membrane protein assembly factor BamB